MRPTPKTEQACNLLRSYAQTPEQRRAVDTLYADMLADDSRESTVVISLLGLILDGLRYGNWLWNMPPAQKVPPGEEGRPGQ